MSCSCNDCDDITILPGNPGTDGTDGTDGNDGLYGGYSSKWKVDPGVVIPILLLVILDLMISLLVL